MKLTHKFPKYGLKDQLLVLWHPKSLVQLLGPNLFFSKIGQNRNLLGPLSKSLVPIFEILLLRILLIIYADNPIFEETI